MKNFDTIYLDFDGCIANTIETIVRLYNRDFSLYEGFQPVDWRDVKTWDFEECRCATKEQIDVYFNQPRFFENVKFMPWALPVIEELLTSYSIKVVSMGNTPNLLGKQELLKDWFPGIEFIGIDFNDHSDKAHIDMSDGALIDDCSANLATSNALEKICFGEVYNWNRDWKGLRLSNWMDVKNYFLGGSKDEL